MRLITINPAFCFGGRDPGEGATDRVHFSDGGREMIATVAAKTNLIRTKQRTSITITVGSGTHCISKHDGCCDRKGSTDIVAPLQQNDNIRAHIRDALTRAEGRQCNVNHVTSSSNDWTIRGSAPVVAGFTNSWVSR